MQPFEPLCLEQITQPKKLDLWLPQLVCLIFPWIITLQEDHQAFLLEAETLYENLLQQLPYVWIAYNRQGMVIAGAALTQVVPHRHAFLHGIRMLEYRKHPIIRTLTQLVLQEAFTTLGIYKLKAEFEADNRGALGFCRMYGFCKEAHFREDNLIQGQRKDVVVYSLFYPTYIDRKAMNKRRV
jgi:RimJ/RimL family protein N-acetyltransferase